MNIFWTYSLTFYNLLIPELQQNFHFITNIRRRLCWAPHTRAVCDLLHWGQVVNLPNDPRDEVGLDEHQPYVIQISKGFSSLGFDWIKSFTSNPCPIVNEWKKEKRNGSLTKSFAYLRITLLKKTSQKVKS